MLPQRSMSEGRNPKEENRELPWVKIFFVRASSPASVANSRCEMVNVVARMLSPDSTYGAVKDAGALWVGACPTGTPRRPALQVGPFSLGIFAIGNIAVAINPDGSIAAPGGSIPGILTKPAKIGGQAAQVVFAGMSPQFFGVNQINVAIPTGTPTGDAVSLQISLGGVTTSATVTIAVSQ